MFFTILIFIFILAVLILSHEFGHFFLAKRAGMKVEEFGFGFPPRLFSFKKGETVYSVNLFPLGGFVKIFGEDGSNKDNKRSFSSRSVLERFGIVAGGVAANILVAYFLFSLGHAVGTPTVLEGNIDRNKVLNISTQIVSILPQSPAEDAGLKVGDKVLNLSSGAESLRVENANSVRPFIESHTGKNMTFTIDRNGTTFDIPLKLRETFDVDKGSAGIQFVEVGFVKHAWYIAVVYGAKTTITIIGDTFYAFFNLIKSGIVLGTLPSDISGPVGIASLTGAVRNLGVVYMIQFIALISLNLAIINILPIPALDGGRLLFLIIEKIKGSPVNKKVENFIHATGFALLILLMIIVTFKDITKL